MRIRGRCHCGNISFELDWRPEPEEITARACDCTFCTKHGGVWTSCPGGALVISTRDQSRVSAYSFGTNSAEFHVCAICGIVPVVTSRIEGRLYAVVNVNTFDGIEPSFIRRATASFEGESGQTRLARRQARWIADVQFAGRAG